MNSSKPQIGDFGLPYVPQGDWYHLSPRQRQEILKSQLRLEMMLAEVRKHWRAQKYPGRPHGCPVCYSADAGFTINKKYIMCPSQTKARMLRTQGNLARSRILMPIARETVTMTRILAALVMPLPLMKPSRLFLYSLLERNRVCRRGELLPKLMNASSKKGKEGKRGTAAAAAPSPREIKPNATNSFCFTIPLPAGHSAR